MLYAQEIKEATWHGIVLPAGLRAFDCRGDNVIRSPWGTVLFASEKAECDLGLRKQNEWYATTPVSCHTYIDSRRAADSQLRQLVKAMVSESGKLWDKWEAAAASRPTSHGGEAVYRPLALCLENFGWCILADKRMSRTRYFL
jgi:hypothetical protein